jgi:ABC-type dipeptide/oligopeptide/nickel transport system ATPase component
MSYESVIVMYTMLGNSVYMLCFIDVAGVRLGRVTFKTIRVYNLSIVSKMTCKSEETYNLRFVSGSTHLLVGPSGCGKTYRVCNIIRLKNQIIENGHMIKNIIFFYAAWQPIYNKLREDGIVNKFIQKKPSSDEFVKLVQDYRDNGGSIVVIDDFMSQIDQHMVDIVTVQSRHHNTNTFILFQSLFPPNKLARQISLNVKYLHVHKNPRENAQIQTLARQLSPQGSKWIVEVYHKVTEAPHQCLLIDLTQQREEKLRYRSNYLPTEFPMRIWLPHGASSV